jgi:hypothetical protein
VASEPTSARLLAVRAPSGPAVAAGAALGGCALLYVRDPNVSGSYGLCPFKALTGWDCPFCGSLRGVHALLHGQLAAALNFNVITIVGLPLVIWYWVIWLRRSRQGHPELPFRTDLAVAVLAVLALFWVVRNLPGVPFLASDR